VFSAGIILHEMLTTEKLFRGDTEFALMEKVRKAEVPAPSEFNRRVTAELDAICLKALSRDVADRYQSAAQLAAALDALISGYRFDPKELRQFMRQLFRKEYAKEVEDTQTSLDPPPDGPPGRPPPPAAAAAAVAGAPAEPLPRAAEPPPSGEPPRNGAPSSDKPRKLLDVLFRRRK
jgi:serine/threonine protein kinase